MKNNLEHILYEEVIHPDGRNYAAYRNSLQPDYKKVHADILSLFIILFVIQLLTASAIRYFHSNWLVIIPGCILNGYFLASLHLFIHEGAHYNLHSEKSTNDKICDLLIGVFFYMPVKKYRKIHWQHHLKLGTTEDTEHSYFNELDLPFIAKVISGIYVISLLSKRKRVLPQSKKKEANIVYFFFVAFFNAVLFILLFASGGRLLFIMWIIGLVVVFPFFAVLRQVLEHRSEEAEKKDDFTKTAHGKISRLFGNGFIDRTFGGAGFNKHLIHHWDPLISYTRLYEIENFLSDCPATMQCIKKSKTSYFKIFLILFKPF